MFWSGDNTLYCWLHPTHGYEGQKSDDRLTHLILKPNKKCTVLS
jgi:hypothetical protein